MPSRRTYTQETIDAIANRFDAAPPVPAPTRYSTSALVRKLVPKIHAMTQNGYTWEAIAAMMADEGVTLSSHALRKYFSQSQDKKKPKKRMNGSQVAGGPKINPAPNSSSPPRKTATVAASRSELTGKDDEWDDLEPVVVEERDNSPATAQQPTHPSGILPRSPMDPAKPTNVAAAGARRSSSSFVVRPDTEDI